MKKNTFYIGTTGCFTRSVDAQKIHDYMIANKHTLTRDCRNAQIVFVSTCAFNQGSEDLSVELIRQYQKLTSGKIIVVGCISKINPARLRELGNFDALSPRSLEKLDQIVNGSVSFASISEPNKVKDFRVNPVNLMELARCQDIEVSFKSRLRRLKEFFKKQFKARNPASYFSYNQTVKDELYHLRVSEGCLSSCSYCAIWHATGRLKSRSLEDITSDFKRGLEQGYKKFIIVSTDLGCWGRDKGMRLSHLLEGIFTANDKADYKVIMENVHPAYLSDDLECLEGLLSKFGGKIQHMTIPIQSGSDRILSLMKRDYTAEEIKKIFTRLKMAYSNLKLATHIMVGFPGETEDDFEMTLELFRRIDVDFVDLYIYEKRPNTKAAVMVDQVPKPEIHRRLQKIKMLNKHHISSV